MALCSLTEWTRDTAEITDGSSADAERTLVFGTLENAHQHEYQNKTEGNAE